MGEVVWFPGQPRSRWSEFKAAVSAVTFHYQRVAFGSQFGMSR